MSQDTSDSPLCHHLGEKNMTFYSDQTFEQKCVYRFVWVSAGFVKIIYAKVVATEPKKEEALAKDWKEKNEGCS